MNFNSERVRFPNQLDSLPCGQDNVDSDNNCGPVPVALFVNVAHGKLDPIVRSTESGVAYGEYMVQLTGCGLTAKDLTPMDLSSKRRPLGSDQKPIDLSTKMKPVMQSSVKRKYEDSSSSATLSDYQMYIMDQSLRRSERTAAKAIMTESPVVPASPQPNKSIKRQLHCVTMKNVDQPIVPLSPRSKKNKILSRSEYAKLYRVRIKEDPVKNALAAEKNKVKCAGYRQKLSKGIKVAQIEGSNSKKRELEEQKQRLRESRRIKMQQYRAKLKESSCTQKLEELKVKQRETACKRYHTDKRELSEDQKIRRRENGRIRNQRYRAKKKLFSIKPGFQNAQVDEEQQRKWNEFYRTNSKYTKNDLDTAIKLVRSNTLSQRAACKAYNIPYTTLRDKVNGKIKLRHRIDLRSVFSKDIEKQIADCVIECGKSGLVRSKNEVLGMVKSVLDFRMVQTPWKSNMPTKPWFEGFLKRHPEITSLSEDDTSMKTSSTVKEDAWETSSTVKEEAWETEAEDYYVEEEDGDEMKEEVAKADIPLKDEINFMGSFTHLENKVISYHGKSLGKSQRQSWTADDRHYPKPGATFNYLIAMALKNSPDGALTATGMYDFICENFPYYRAAPPVWKSVMRHYLTAKRNLFVKVERPCRFVKEKNSPRRGNFWSMNPSKMDAFRAIFEDLIVNEASYLDSMAYPERFGAYVHGFVPRESYPALAMLLNAESSVASMSKETPPTRSRLKDTPEPGSSASRDESLSVSFTPDKSRSRTGKRSSSSLKPG